MTSTSPSIAILGLGTALPENRMTQDEAAFLAETICARNDEERRLVKVLYRKAGVKQRFTAVPHSTALEWLAAPATVVAATSNGATIGTANGATIGHSTNGHAANGHDANGHETNGHATVAEGEPNGEPEPIVHHGPTTFDRMNYYREFAPGLALESSRAALADAKVRPEEITHVITVSCTGFFAPGVDCALIEGLDLPRTTERIQVGFMGCHGAVNGLRAATALVAADPRRRVLLCCVELCSLHYCFEWDPLRAVGNAVFADGSAALVVGPAEAGQPRLVSKACGSYLIPESADAMAWDIGNHGFEMLLSPRVPILIGEHLRPWIEQWLAQHGLSIDKIGGWAVHPGGPRVLTAVEEALGLDRSATAVSREVLASCGNMSSPTILFILDRMQKADIPRPYVALGFGPGLAAEAALFV